MTPEVGKTYKFTLQPLSPAYMITEVDNSFAYGYPVGDPSWLKEISIAIRKGYWDDLVEVGNPDES